MERPLRIVAIATRAPLSAFTAGFVLGLGIILAYTATSHLSVVPILSTSTASATSTFVYSFNSTGTLQEASRVAESTSPYWFLDSGGTLLIGGGIGQTVHGALPESDRWYRAYARSSPADTDGGTHPQNLFRLLTRSRWGDSTSQVALRIDADNLSASENRNASNGLFFMSRYQDADTLYYAGVRVDGTAVIKKKYRGTYYTLAQKPLFAGTYDRKSAPDLLPHGQWLTLALETLTLPDGNVRITLSLAEGTSTPRVVLSTKDDGAVGGTPSITTPGLMGIRTDFMDVSMKDFRSTGVRAP